MKIGIIGTGNVGSALGTGFAERGHRVMLGSRMPLQRRLQNWIAEDPQHRRIGDRWQAVDFGEMVFFAIPGRALPETVDAIGREGFSGKTVVDVTNPFGRDENGRTIDTFGDNDSGAEVLQRTLPDAYVVKAFNEIDAPVMFHPERTSGTVRIAGDDEAAKRRVAELLESIGWRVDDLGPLAKARELEHAVIDSYARV